MKHVAWPHYRRPWRLLLESVDGAAVVDETHRRVTASSTDWNWLELSAVVDTTELPSDGAEAARCFLLISSARANSRIPVALDRVSSQRFRGSVPLERGTLAGAVHVEAQMVGGTPARLVATSDQWTIAVDESAAPPRPGVPPFDVVWHEFSAADAPPLAREARETFALMDLTGPSPVLRLNRDIVGFESLINAPRAQLERRRLRDVLGTSIARRALDVVLREAVARIDVADDGTVSPPDERLLRQVLDAVAAEMPDVAQLEDFYLSIARPQDLPALDRARLWARIDIALDRLTDHAEYVATAVSEVRHV